MKKEVKLTAIIEKTDDGGYVGQLQEFPEVISQGDTIDLLIANLQDAFALWISCVKKDNQLITKGRNHIIRRKISFA